MVRKRIETVDYLCHWRFQTDAGVFYLGSTLDYFRDRRFRVPTVGFIHSTEGEYLSSTSYQINGVRPDGFVYGGLVDFTSQYRGAEFGLVDTETLPNDNFIELSNSADLLSFETTVDTSGLFWVCAAEQAASQFWGSKIELQLASLESVISANLKVIAEIGKAKVESGLEIKALLPYYESMLEPLDYEGMFLPVVVRGKTGWGVLYINKIGDGMLAECEYYSSSGLNIEADDLLTSSARIPAANRSYLVPLDSPLRHCKIEIGLVTFAQEGC
ncbi:MAG: hypothetical protein EOP04_14310 [Proteobacteria bacterium]|nr:MAG: hypothetical protein EOP04_14310 [Pseudomonadota bacterium]